MRQGTTPIISFDVAQDFTYTNVYVTLDQNGEKITKASRTSDDIEITKHYDDEGVFDYSTVAMALSQAETLKLEVGNARVQIGWVDYAGRARKTDIGTVKIEESLLEEVMTYGE